MRVFLRQYWRGVLIGVLVCLGTLAVMGYLRSHGSLRSQLGSGALSQDSLFMWIGASRRQFSAQEVGQIANRTSFVILAPFHNGGSIAGILEDIQRLKKLQPNLKVYAYMNATLLNPAMELEMYDAGFRDEWLLRAEIGSSQGQVLKLSPAKDAVSYIDIANPDYRAWLENFLKTQRYASGLFDGVVFDSFNSKGVPLGYLRSDYWQGREYWEQHLTSAKIAALDNALQDILMRTKKIDATKLVGMNGFSSKPFRIGVNHRNEYYWKDNKFPDFVLHEEFCAWSDADQAIVYATPSEILSDLEIMRDSTAITKLFQVNAANDLDPELVSRVQDYCYGLYLIGKAAGSMHGGGRYRVDTTLTYWPRGITFDYGKPVANFVYDAVRQIFTREYERGYVISNIANRSIALPAPVAGWIAGHLLNGVANQSYTKGQAVPLAPRSSYFLVRTVQSNPGE